MKGWICRRYVDPFEIEWCDLPEPKLGPTDVRLAMRAGGISWESLVLRGKYQVSPPLPYIVGGEISGEILAIGPGVERFKVGDRVIALVNTLSDQAGGGCFVERPVVDDRFLVPMPETLGFEEAAALRSSFETAYHALRRRDNLSDGETVLVHGAAGGVGGAAVQICKLYGARVIAIASSAEKRAAALADGADVTFCSNRPNLRELIMDATGGRGVDMVFDPVGGDLFDIAVRVVRPGGRILVVGFTAGRFSTIASNQLLVRMISVVGIELRKFSILHPDLATRDSKAVLELARAGRLKPRVGTTFPLEALPEAFRHIDGRNAVGKTVIVSGGLSARRP